MPSKIFEKVNFKKPRYSAFDLSREQKLSCRFGQLIPTYLDEIVPGDQFNVRTETLVRLAPMIAPVMHRVNVFMHYFYVPNRIIWSQWEDFITGGQNGETNPVFPTNNITRASFRNSKLADYLGVPIQQLSTFDENGPVASMLPFRAYQKIWNEYFRDPNLHQELDVNSAAATELVQLKYRCWEKDYFTSSLPFAQRGEEVGVPIDLEYQDVSTVTTIGGGDPGTGNVQTGLTPDRQTLRDNSGDALRIENLVADKLDFSINDLRKSSAIQRWLERAARGGYRYVETLMSQFGVKSDDARLQRPEYLGGGKQPITISEVLNTTGTENAPQGDMSGHGVSTGTTNSFKKTFKEHGYVMGILSVLPKTAYQQGLPRHFSRQDKFDYYWPEFADLGEQEVKRKELYLSDDQEINEQTFGYQQRYAEYKYGQSTVHGDFKESSLDFWHMGRKFSTNPNLNTAFVEYPSDGPDQRAFAVEGEDNLWIQLYHNVKARRPMPFFADPKLT